MKKHILHILAIFSLFFVVSCTSEYHDHFYGERNIENVSQVDSGDFVSGGDIISFPRKGGEDFLLSAIEQAKEKIWIEIYSFTKNEAIFQALLDAKNRGVDVRVLLEGNVFSSPYINTKTYKFFQENGISVKYTDNNRYVFTHAKFWLIDGKYFISTGNWTKSFFTKNREYIYTDSDSTTHDFLQQIFLRDFDYMGFSQKSDIPPHIVISPLNSREKIEQFIQTSEKELFVYMQTVTDARILEILEEAQKGKKGIFLCTADNDGNKKAMMTFSGSWHIAKKPYLHAKIMISDEKNIFLGSQNFTNNSLQNNREMGIILSGRKDLYESLKKDIIEHCKS